MTVSVDKGAGPKRIAVIVSADGSEATVSERSAENVVAALEISFPDVRTFAFNSMLARELKRWRADVAFPVSHGAGETGTLQALLDSIGLQYVGSGAESSADCWNKSIANERIAASEAGYKGSDGENHSFLVPSSLVLHRHEQNETALVSFLVNQMANDSVVIKPAGEGSSVGIYYSKAPTAFSSRQIPGASTVAQSEQRVSEVLGFVEAAHKHDDTVIVQHAIRGTEITVGVLEEPEMVALPVIEIATPDGSWYDYEHKYSAGASRHLIPARLPAETLDFAQRMAMMVHRALGCRDYSRTDMIVERANSVDSLRRVYYLETNTLPGFTKTSLFPDAAEAAGVPLEQLVRGLVLRAWCRGGKLGA